MTFDPLRQCESLVSGTGLWSLVTGLRYWSLVSGTGLLVLVLDARLGQHCKELKFWLFCVCKNTAFV